jgi:hypothetical protein
MVLVEHEEAAKPPDTHLDCCFTVLIEHEEAARTGYLTTFLTIMRLLRVLRRANEAAETATFHTPRPRITPRSYFSKT